MSSERLVIRGGKRLVGEVSICGGKNAALAVIPVALLTNDVCTIENLPDIDDIDVLSQMLAYIGAKVTITGRSMTIDPSGVDKSEVPADLASRIRGSSYFLGALLGRCGHSYVPLPGGCNIGQRKMDQHFKGFNQLGAVVKEYEDAVEVESDMLVGTEIYLDMPSVGATVNILLAAVTAKGDTIISNAGKEPHIVDLANMLNAMGARIRGAGTNVIRIKGVEKLHGCTYMIIPDQIETGTLMIAAAATGGDITIHGAIPVHMEALTAKLFEMGVRVYEGDDMIRVVSGGYHRAVNIETLPYPGFPTDLQQPMAALLTCAHGTSTINETIFENRHQHIAQLVRMGADADVNGRIATIRGVEKLHGAQIVATDLRAGAAMIVAALMADGISEIENVHYIDRGYEHIEDKLRSLGAQIERIIV